MSTYSQFKRNESAEQQGVVIDMGDAGKFTIARSGGSNKKYQKRLESAMRPHRRAFQQGTLSDDTAAQILLSVFVDSVLLDWSCVTGEDGKPVPFSRANAEKLLTDLPDLFATLREASADAAMFKGTGDAESDSGNSPKS